MSILWYGFFFFKQSFMIGSLNILDFTSNLCKAIFFFLQKYLRASSVSLGRLFFSVKVLLLWCSVYYRGPLSSPVRTSPDSCKRLLFWCGLFSTQPHRLRELLGLCNTLACALHLVSMMVLVDPNSSRETCQWQSGDKQGEPFGENYVSNG